MTLTSTAALIAEAVARGRAVAAFNVITLEHAEAIADGAERAGVGVILQLSQNAIAFHGGALRPILFACREIAAGATVPMAVHLDHVDDLGLIAEAIALAGECGLGSVMIDASELDYDANVAVTADVVRRAHEAGLWVEAELGEIGGKDGAHAPGVRTNPVEAASFVSATGVDALAVAVGSSHAMLDRSATIDLDLVSRLAAAVGVPLVLHGSSGVDDAGLAAAVAAGIRKVNIGTALNIAGTTALRVALDAEPDAVDPRAPLRASRAAMTDAVAAACSVVG
jgi:fructose-bisphosphate aldolase, class II